MTMKIMLVFGVVALGAATARAQFYFADSNLWVTAQERARVEYRSNNYTFNSGITADSDTFLLQRARLGLGAKACDWFKAYGELQDAREIASQRFVAGKNPNLEEDTIDWRQGWGELANYAEFPVGLKVGRQELSYGDERLIGVSDWSNTGRVFDAIKLRWQSKQFWIDAFGANVVNNNVNSGRDNSFDDKAEWADDFYGLYGSTTFVTNHVWDVYGLLRDKADAKFAGAKRQLYTVGTRFLATPALAPWDYNVELIGQFGHVQTPGSQFGETRATWASHEAFASTFNVGYTFDHEWKPRLAAGYDYASGDHNPNNGEDGTFDPLFPTAHRPLGFLDAVGFKNIHNPHATFAFAPHKTLKLQLDGHLFWLAESRDAWYRANQQQIRRDIAGNSSSFVGSEIDFTATYSPIKRVKLQVGYSHFLTGGFVGDTGPHSDADFAYGQVTLSL